MDASNLSLDQSNTLLQFLHLIPTHNLGWRALSQESMTSLRQLDPWPWSLLLGLGHPSLDSARHAPAWQGTGSDLELPTNPTVMAESILLDWMVEDSNMVCMRESQIGGQQSSFHINPATPHHRSQIPSYELISSPAIQEINSQPLLRIGTSSLQHLTTDRTLASFFNASQEETQCQQCNQSLLD